MPTIILLKGWRVSFFADEGAVPIHVHCRKGNAVCKFWILRDSYDIKEAYLYNMTPKDRREIKKILFDHFDVIVEAWDSFRGV